MNIDLTNIDLYRLNFSLLIAAYFRVPDVSLCKIFGMKISDYFEAGFHNQADAFDNMCHIEEKQHKIHRSSSSTTENSLYNPEEFSISSMMNKCQLKVHLNGLPFFNVWNLFSEEDILDLIGIFYSTYFVSSVLDLYKCMYFKLKRSLGNLSFPQFR